MFFFSHLALRALYFGIDPGVYMALSTTISYGRAKHLPRRTFGLGCSQISPSIDTSSSTTTTCGTRLGGSPAGLPFMLTRFCALKDHIYTTRVRLFSRLLRMRCRLFFSLLPLLLVLKTIGWRVVRLNDAMNFLHFPPLLSLLGMNL